MRRLAGHGRAWRSQYRGGAGSAGGTIPGDAVMYPGLVDILRCPSCGSSSELVVTAVFDVAEDGEILAGLLRCPDCGRWFRVEEGIADLVPDGLREVDEEKQFLESHGDRVPDEWRMAEKPLGLDGGVPARSEADRRIVEEGRHWGRFMRRFWDVGDRSIFDIRAKGSHPSFYVKGILEPDERDRYRRWGFFPARTGEMLFGGLELFAGKRGVDIGCGGGQFGLEAARCGIDMVGFDPSFEEIRLARLYARENGVRNIDYVRADPSHPPFADETFDVLLAKDALHHVPELKRVFGCILAKSTKAAMMICFEHTDHARFKEAILRRVTPRLVPRIRARYHNVEVPPELLHDSANEDVSAGAIRPLLESYFERVYTREDLFFAEEIEMYVYYLFGRRQWPARISYAVAWLVERLLLLLGDRQHLAFVGRRRPGKLP